MLINVERIRDLDRLNHVPFLPLLDDPGHGHYTKCNLWSLDGNGLIPDCFMEAARVDYRVKMAGFKTTMWTDGIPTVWTMKKTGTISPEDLDTLLILGQRVVAHAFTCYGISAVNEWGKIADLLKDCQRFDGLETSKKSRLEDTRDLAEKVLLDRKYKVFIKEWVVPDIRSGKPIPKDDVISLGNFLGGPEIDCPEKCAIFCTAIDALEETGRLGELRFEPGIVEELKKRSALYHQRELERKSDRVWGRILSRCT